MNQTQKNLKIVLERIINVVVNDKNEAAIYAEEFDILLNDLSRDDFFGTEGQCDPRGDCRNGTWLINGVVEQ